MSEQYPRVVVEWSSVVKDLNDRGYSIYRIAKLLKASQCAVKNWSKGGEPGFGLGAALIKLHSDATMDNATSSKEDEAAVT
jgi:predicted transcriptional regulator